MKITRRHIDNFAYAMDRLRIQPRLTVALAWSLTAYAVIEFVPDRTNIGAEEGILLGIIAGLTTAAQNFYHRTGVELARIAANGDAPTKAGQSVASFDVVATKR